MAMVVRSNLMAYNANRQLGMNNSAVSKNLEKLSSGFKINRAADDAAGLAVSEKMKAQIKGLEQASLNSQDGISLVQTAEGALTEVHDMLNRMTELATKSANGTIQDDVDREAIQNEVNKLNDEIDRISESTNFNGIKLLNGNLGNGPSASGKGINAYGISGTDVFDVTSNAEVKRVDQSNAVMTAPGSAGGKGEKFKTTLVNGKTGETKEIEITLSDNASSNTPTAMGTQIAKDLNSNSTIGSLFNVSDDGTGKLKFESKSGDSDWYVSKLTASAATGAVATSLTAGGHVVTKASTAYSAANTVLEKKPSGTAAAYAAGDTMVIGGKKFEVVAADGDKPTKSGYTAVTLGGGDGDLAANLSKLTGLDITNDGTAGKLTIKEKASTSGGTSGAGLTLQIGESGDSYNQVTVSVGNMGSKGIGTNGLDVANQDSAKAAIDVIKSAINTVSSNRSELGALQNRLEHTINNLDVAAENMTNANSRIRDTDMAKQMMDYTKMNVLTQSAQAMLAQANQNPQSILQLLQ